MSQHSYLTSKTVTGLLSLSPEDTPSAHRRKLVKHTISYSTLERNEFSLGMSKTSGWWDANQKWVVTLCSTGLQRDLQNHYLTTSLELDCKEP